MARYRSKPVVKEAIRYLGPFSIDEMVDAWGRLFSESIVYSESKILSIKTLEGTMFPSIGDWIVKGIQGEFYPVKDEIFRATYEPVEELK